MKNYLLLLVAVASFTFTSCSGDDDDTTITPTPTPAATKTELITNKNWMVTNIKASIDNAPESDFTNSFGPCVLDNLDKYHVNNTYLRDEGATKCDPADPQIIEAGSWIFSNDEKKLLRTLGTKIVEYDIIELTQTKLILKNTETGMGNTITSTITFEVK